MVIKSGKFSYGRLVILSVGGGACSFSLPSKVVSH